MLNLAMGSNVASLCSIVFSSSWVPQQLPCLYVFCFGVVECGSSIAHVSLPHCGGEGVLVVVSLPALGFDASPLQVDFAAKMLASASFSMSGLSLFCSKMSPLAFNSYMSKLCDMSSLIIGDLFTLPLGQSYKYVFSSKYTTSKFLMIFFVSKQMNQYIFVFCNI